MENSEEFFSNPIKGNPHIRTKSLPLGRNKSSEQHFVNKSINTSITEIILESKKNEEIDFDFCVPSGKKLSFGIGYIDPESLDNYFEHPEPFTYNKNDKAINYLSNKLNNNDHAERADTHMIKSRSFNNSINNNTQNNNLNTSANITNQLLVMSLPSLSENKLPKDLNTNNNKFLLEKIISMRSKGHFSEISRSKTLNKFPSSNVNSRFERLKGKIDAGFVHFLKRHRFSTMLIGNKKYKNKCGDDYLKEREQKNNEHNEGEVEYNIVSEKSEKDYATTGRKKIESDNNLLYNTNLQQQQEKNNKSKVTKENINKINKLKDVFTISNAKKEDSKNASSTSKIEIQISKSKNKNSIPKENKIIIPIKNKQPRKSEIVPNIQIFKNFDIKSNNIRSSVDLTPIPKRNIKPNKVNVIEYGEAERAAVTIRRIEYSFSFKNKQESVTQDAQNIYLNLLLEAKTIIIQRWWKKVIVRFRNYSKYTLTIQKYFRGYLSRFAFKSVVKEIYQIFPFLLHVSFIIEKHMFNNAFAILFKKFGILSHQNFLIKKINLIKRNVRDYVRMKKNKQMKIKKCISKIAYKSFFYFIKKLKIRVYVYNRIISLQALIRSSLVRILNSGRNYHPYLFYYFKYKRINSSSTTTNNYLDLKRNKNIFQNLKYFIKKHKFYQIVKKISFFSYKRKFQEFINIIQKSNKTVNNKSYFNEFTKKMQSYRLYLLKIRMISRNIKELIPLIQRSCKRLYYSLWKEKYWVSKNKCRLVVKSLGEVLRYIVFTPFKRQVNLFTSNKENIKLLFNLIKIKSKFQFSGVKFNKWRSDLKISTLRENKIKNILKRKDIIMKKIYFKRLKNLCYYIFSTFGFSIKFYFGLDKIKTALMKNLIRLYKANVTSMSNLKELFKNRKLVTKLKKVLKITNVYYENEKKVYFNQWIGIANKINEIKMAKKSKLIKIINAKKKILKFKLKDAIKKWNIKSLKRVNIFQTNNEKNNNLKVFNIGIFFVNKFVENKLKEYFNKIKLFSNNRKIEKILVAMDTESLLKNRNDILISSILKKDIKMTQLLKIKFIFWKSIITKLKIKDSANVLCTYTNYIYSIIKKGKMKTKLKILMKSYKYHSELKTFTKFAISFGKLKKNINIFSNVVRFIFYKQFFSKLILIRKYKITKEKISFMYSNDKINRIKACNKMLKSLSIESDFHLHEFAKKILRDNLLKKIIQRKVEVTDKNIYIRFNYWKLNKRLESLPIESTAIKQILRPSLKIKVNNIKIVSREQQSKIKFLFEKTNSEKTKIYYLCFYKWREHASNQGYIKSAKTQKKTNPIRKTVSFNSSLITISFNSTSFINNTRAIIESLINKYQSSHNKALMFYFSKWKKIINNLNLFSAASTIISSTKRFLMKKQLSNILLKKTRNKLIKKIINRNIHYTVKHYFSKLKIATNMNYITACTKSIKMIFKKKKNDENVISIKMTFLKHILKRYDRNIYKIIINYFNKWRGRKENISNNNLLARLIRIKEEKIKLISQLNFTHWRSVNKTFKIIEKIIFIQKFIKTKNIYNKNSNNYSSTGFNIKKHSSLKKIIQQKDVARSKLLQINFNSWQKNFFIFKINSSAEVINKYNLVIMNRLKALINNMYRRNFKNLLITALNSKY